MISNNHVNLQHGQVLFSLNNQQFHADGKTVCHLCPNHYIQHQYFTEFYQILCMIIFQLLYTTTCTVHACLSYNSYEQKKKKNDKDKYMYNIVAINALAPGSVQFFKRGHLFPITGEFLVKNHVTSDRKCPPPHYSLNFLLLYSKFDKCMSVIERNWSKIIVKS